MQEEIAIKRPDRWDHPLDTNMSDETIRWLLSYQPFSAMDPDRFSTDTPLLEILRNDCRLWDMQPGELVFQEGQYGDSAYLVLDGTVRVFLNRLLTEAELSKRRISRSRPSRWLRILSPLRLGIGKGSDRRSRERKRSLQRNVGDNGEEKPVELQVRKHGTRSAVFLQDIPGVLATHRTTCLTTGELFGEMAAVTRSPREFTAVADSACQILEIRWQGLKLLKQDPVFRAILDERYRSEVLRTHLRESELFRFVPDEQLDQIVAATQLEQFGDLEWFAKYRQHRGKPPGHQVSQEPLIAPEGQYAGALWIVRAGFARVSRRQGAGHRTLAYLGKGQIFGLSELAHNLRQPGHSPPLPYQESLRAIGYVDLLRIPKQTVVEHLLPYVRAADLPAPIESARYQFGQPVLDAPLNNDANVVETGLLEFLVEQRLINGRQAMVIDLNRCTRCDDCVRACATTHGGSPVFVRQGPRHGPWMFAQACMHCEDPVCMIGCPTGAIHRDIDTGLVQIDSATCIGCKGCAESCPYENIRMVPRQDQQGRIILDQATRLPILQASKCDLCSSGLGQPACQSSCPHDALKRVNLSVASQLGQHVTRKAG